MSRSANRTIEERRNGERREPARHCRNRRDGAGIAQIAAQSGLNVVLFDKNEGAAHKARDGLKATFDKLVGKGKITRQSAEVALSHLSVVESLPALADCDVVIEAIVEDLGIKQALFADLEAIVDRECILATNTSSLSVTSIAADLNCRDRVAGFHFFNPVPLMKVIEVVGGIDTNEAVVDTLLKLATRLGHTGVRAQDTPGFIVNHAGRAYSTEGLKILEERVAPIEDIDRILREEAGFRMGPLELLISPAWMCPILRWRRSSRSSITIRVTVRLIYPVRC
ncbi:hypothetical protein HAALTHF_13370n [Vreelandella aquamarina]|nr:hypothetical protein HAALTHF_13370n [Halomonas axialensis]